MSNFRSALQIDKFNLDEECAQQAVKFMEHAEASVEAEYQRDIAKIKLELMYATIDSEIRGFTAERGIKIAEKGIESEILRDERYQTARQEYTDKVRDANLLISARHAFAQRKDMIEQECRLFLAGYYAEQTGTQAREVGEDAVRKRICSKTGQIIK